MSFKYHILSFDYYSIRAFKLNLCSCPVLVSNRVIQTLIRNYRLGIF